MRKGSKMTIEQRRRLSIAHKNQKPSQETKEKIRAFMKVHPERWFGGKIRKGEESPNWRGGVSNNGNGYIRIYKPDHPNSDKRGYVYEHRLLAENALGRRLKFNEIVHHIDGNSQNNNSENLQVMSYGQHIRYHESINNRMETQNAEKRN